MPQWSIQFAVFANFCGRHFVLSAHHLPRSISVRFIACIKLRLASVGLFRIDLSDSEPIFPEACSQFSRHRGHGFWKAIRERTRARFSSPATGNFAPRKEWVAPHCCCFLRSYLWRRFQRGPVKPKLPSHRCPALQSRIFPLTPNLRCQDLARLPAPVLRQPRQPCWEQYSAQATRQQE